MQRRTADGLAATLVGVVLLAGLVWTWQVWTAAQTTSTDGTIGGMMDGQMMQPAPSPLGPLLGTVVLVAVLGGGYLLVREQVAAGGRPASGADVRGFEADSTLSSRDGGVASADDEGDDTPATASQPEEGATRADEIGPSGVTSRPLLDVLPEDERRVLEPVVESPGITQIELRDRADFSKSKVSQTVSDLEKRGLIARERQGRTYRVYPAGELGEGPAN
ncbi:MAG: helix-turn-helix transcriptional regulator [Halanaeroarchaeum sp.]